MAEPEGRCLPTGETSCRSSAATSPKTLAQSPTRSCLNSRARPYQGVSVRSSIHRYSGAAERQIHTGRPKAPARCATEQFTAITRSSSMSVAAVSHQSRSSGLRS